MPNRFQITVRHHRRRKRRHDRRVSLALRRPRLSDRQILLRVPNRFRKILAICPHHHLRPTRRHQHLPLPWLRQKQIIKRRPRLDRGIILRTHMALRTPPSRKRLFPLPHQIHLRTKRRTRKKRQRQSKQQAFHEIIINIMELKDYSPFGNNLFG